MKKKINYILVALLITGFTACKKDNFDAPETTLSGRLVYQGEQIFVEQDQVSFELWQSGFGKYAPIRSSFNQEGQYSTKLFNGTYKFVIPSGQGPFKGKTDANGKADSLLIELAGNKISDIEVTPFYLIKNADLSANSGKVSAAFDLEKVITGAEGKNVERVTLYVNKTQFVSGNSNSHIAQSTLSGDDLASLSNLTLSVDIPMIVPAQNYIFARVGLKIQGVEDMIFSPLSKLML